MREPESSQIALPGNLFASSYSEKKHDTGSYIWLVYSAFFFIEPILRHSRTYWLRQMPIYALFLALYIAYIEFERGRIRLLILGVFFLLGVGDIPFNVGASSFFIYVAAMLPFCVESTRALISVMAAEVVTLAIESQVFPHDPFNYLITGLFTLVVGVSNLFVAQGKRADCKLRAAQQENIALAAVAERERIARDLHDVLGHTLSVIVLKAELAGRLLQRENDRDTTRAAAEIADVERTARTALAEVREAIGGYRSKGLRAELDQARLTLDAAGVILDCPATPPPLLPSEETVLSLAVREAVTNIVRHAQATRCTMRFEQTPDGFDALFVADNGRGAAAPENSGREGNGLRGMRERVQALGGRLRVECGQGTRLTIELPHRTPSLPATPELPEVAPIPVGTSS
jgi:two-component system sensor histidine kinase DesK